MESIKFSIVLSSVLSVLGCQMAVAEKCIHTAHREVTLDASGANLLVIDAEAGRLDVRGESDLPEVHTRGTACTSRAAQLDEVRLATQSRGNTLYLTTEFPRRVEGQARFDLKVRVPSGIPVRIIDESGDIDVRAVASLEIDDDSGGIVVWDVVGDVIIEDDSGSIDVLGVGGSVRIDDGSGEIEVAGIGVSVDLDDGSGDLAVRDVDGDVTVREDGSGLIDIERVGGTVLIHDDGSGDIAARHVDGDFILRDDGAGVVQLEEIRGRISMAD